MVNRAAVLTRSHRAQVSPSPWGRAIPAPCSALDLAFSTELPGLMRAGRTRGDLTLSPDEDRRRPKRCSVGVFVTSLSPAKSIAGGFRLCLVLFAP